MLRNMFHRVETCFPIKHKKIRDRIFEEMELYLRDNTHAWLLQSDGSYVPTQPQKDEEPIDAQATLLERWTTQLL